MCCELRRVQSFYNFMRMPNGFVVFCCVDVVVVVITYSIIFLQLQR
jgi:hypothetical protein